MDVIADEELKLAVEDLLNGDPLIDATGIEVVAELGFISLRGFVQDREQRGKVERLVLSYPGVKDVFNYLSLRPKGLVGDANLPHNVI